MFLIPATSSCVHGADFRDPVFAPTFRPLLFTIPTFAPPLFRCRFSLSLLFSTPTVHSHRPTPKLTLSAQTFHETADKATDDEKTKPPKNQKRNGGTESTDKLKKCETRNDESDAGAKPVPLTRSHRLSGESVRGNGLNFIALKISTTLGTFRNYYGLRFLAGLDVRAWELRGKAEIPPGSPTPY